MGDILMKHKVSPRGRLTVWLLGLCLAGAFNGGAVLISAPAFADGDPGARKRASRRVTPSKRRGQKSAQSYWDADFTIALKSDYIFRGFSQNDDRITPQLEFVMNFVNGAHFSIWTSAVEDDYFDAAAEVEYNIGYTHATSDQIDLDYGLRYYYYPGSSIDSGYSEVYFTVMHQLHPDHAAHFGVMYANEYYDHTDELWRTWAEYRYNWKGLNVWANIGWNFFDDQENGYLKYVYGSDSIDAYNEALANLGANQSLTGRSLLISQDTDDSYVDFSVGVSHKFNDFLTLAFELTDTDLASSACADRCGEHAIVSLYWQF